MILAKIQLYPRNHIWINRGALYGHTIVRGGQGRKKYFLFNCQNVTFRVKQQQPCRHQIKNAYYFPANRYLIL